MKVKDTWWKDAFGKGIFPLSTFEKSFRKVTPSQVKFLVNKVKLKKSSKVLDLGCGVGRHSILLAKLGMTVTGLDFSGKYLVQAKKDGKKLPIKWVRKDMRAINYKDEFDCVINMWSSFGYFSTADNRRTAKKVHQSLKKNGYFFIDIINGDFVRKNFLKKQWSRLEDGAFHLEEGEFDPKKLRIQTQWYFFRAGGPVKKMQSKMDLYDKKGMVALLRQSGFKKIKFFGSFDGAKMTTSSYRMIVIAKK